MSERKHQREEKEGEGGSAAAACSLGRRRNERQHSPLLRPSAGTLVTPDVALKLTRRRHTPPRRPSRV